MSPGKLLQTRTAFILVCLLVPPVLGPTSIQAGVAGEVIDQTLEYLAKHFAPEVAEEFGEHGSQVLARELAVTAARYGEKETVSAVEKAGPRLLRIVADAGDEGGPRLIKMVNRVGDDSIYIVARPRSVAIFLKFGDTAVDAMLKHKGIAEQLIEEFGKPAADALNAIDGRNARRLIFLIEDGTVRDRTQAPALLDTIGRYGGPAVDWVWENRTALGTAGLLPKFLADPRHYLDKGGKSLDADAGKPMDATATFVPPTPVNPTSAITRYGVAGLVMTVSVALIVSIRTLARIRARMTGGNPTSKSR